MATHLLRPSSLFTKMKFSVCGKHLHPCSTSTEPELVDCTLCKRTLNKKGYSYLSELLKEEMRDEYDRFFAESIMGPFLYGDRVNFDVIREDDVWAVVPSLGYFPRPPLRGILAKVFGLEVTDG